MRKTLRKRHAVGLAAPVAVGSLLVYAGVRILAPIILQWLGLLPSVPHSYSNLPSMIPAFTGYDSQRDPAFLSTQHCLSELGIQLTPGQLVNYHLVIQADPSQVHWAKHLSISLLSVFLHEASPNSTTVLWKSHRPKDDSKMSSLERNFEFSDQARHMYIPDNMPVNDQSLLLLSLALPQYIGQPESHLLLLSAGTYLLPGFHVRLCALHTHLLDQHQYQAHLQGPSAAPAATGQQGFHSSQQQQGSSGTDQGHTQDMQATSFALALGRTSTVIQPAAPWLKAPADAGHHDYCSMLHPPGLKLLTRADPSTNNGDHVPGTGESTTISSSSNSWLLPPATHAAMLQLALSMQSDEGGVDLAQRASSSSAGGGQTLGHQEGGSSPGLNVPGSYEQMMPISKLCVNIPGCHLYADTVAAAGVKEGATAAAAGDDGLTGGRSGGFDSFGSSRNWGRGMALLGATAMYGDAW